MCCDSSEKRQLQARTSGYFLVFTVRFDSLLRDGGWGIVNSFSLENLGPNFVCLSTGKRRSTEVGMLLPWALEARNHGRESPKACSQPFQS